MNGKIRKWLDKIPCGLYRSRWVNVLYGKWRVTYPDGKISEPMYYDVAQSYREIFGGVIKYTGDST